MLVQSFCLDNKLILVEVLKFVKLSSGELCLLMIFVSVMGVVIVDELVVIVDLECIIFSVSDQGVVELGVLMVLAFEFILLVIYYQWQG